MIQFETQLRGERIEVTADDFEYSPDINISGPQTLFAVYADTGEPFDFESDEEDQAFLMACEIHDNQGTED